MSRSSRLLVLDDVLDILVGEDEDDTEDGDALDVLGLERDQAELGEEQTIGEVMLLAEVRGEGEDGTYTYIRYRCTDVRQWVQRGMLHAALEQDRQPDLDEDED
jgi:hypothetical protein